METVGIGGAMVAQGKAALMPRKLTAVLLIGFAALLAGCGSDRLALSQLPQRVSRQNLDGEPVIAVRQERAVRVFVADVHHLEGEEDALVWCPTERLIAATTHGEAFDEKGVVVGGPASRNLDEVPVEFSRGYIVATGDPAPGPLLDQTSRFSMTATSPGTAGPDRFVAECRSCSCSSHSPFL